MGKLGDEMVDLVGFVMPKLPQNKPNHLLGIADVPSIEKCVTHGVDTFDSAFPTRIGQSPDTPPLSCSMETRARTGSYSIFALFFFDGSRF